MSSHLTDAFMYVAQINPRLHITHFKAKVIIAIFFLMGFSYSCWTTWRIMTTKAEIIYFAMYIYGISLLIFTGMLYLRLYIVVRRAARVIGPQEDTITGHSRHLKHLIVLTKTVVFILLSLLCCYLPYITMGMIVVLYSKRYTKCVNPTMLFILNLCRTAMYANSII